MANQWLEQFKDLTRCVNTAKRKKPKEGDDSDAKKPFVARSAIDVQKRQLEKLMKDPDKLIELPKSRKEWKPRDAPEFVRHVMGSSAGAGSGEFHVYRGLRERETKRNEWLDAQAAKRKAEEQYHQKIDKNKQEAEQKTAKLRAKRQKKKQRRAVKKKETNTDKDEKQSECKDESEEEDEGETEEKHFVIGGR